MIANAALPLAASADPPLKPNQPTDSSAAPAIVRAGLCGSRGVLGKPARLPIRIAMASAETPAVVWTTIPPAKSSVPKPLAIQPPPQIQCATGA